MSNPHPSRFEALNLMIGAYGGQKETADGLRRINPTLSQATVSRWVNQSKQLPDIYVLAAEADTGVSRHWLRPDLYPRGLIDGVPYEPEEPLLDVFTPIQFTQRPTGQDNHAGDADARFHGVDRRAGAAL